MIRWQRTIRVAGGKNMEAVQWSKEVTDYVNGKQPKYKVQSFASRFGDTNIIAWQVDFKDLADLEKYQDFFNGDQGYWGLISKAIPLFIEGSSYDTVFDEL